MEINQYPLESFAFQDNDFYDIDFWTGSGYQTKKILGSTIKAGILAAVENIYNTDGTLTGSRAVNIDGNIMSFISNNAGEFEVILDNGSSEFSKYSQTLAQIFLQIQSSIPTNQLTLDLNTINTQLVINDGVNYASLQVSGVGSALNFTDGITQYRVEANENGVVINTSYTLPNTDGTSGQVMRTNGSGIVSFQSLPVEIQVAASDEITPLTLGNGKVTFRMPHRMTLTEVRASLTTAQVSGAIFRIDVIQNGVSVLSTKCTIDNTERTSTSATTLPVIAISALADDSEMRVDITQIGDGTAKGLKVTLIGTRK